MNILKDYDTTLEKIINDGDIIPNRTGKDCLVLIGTQCRYDISESFPIPTKRKYPYKSIISELIWMVSGSTNINELESMGSKIWSPWRDKSFEDKNGYNDGDLGPIYGYNFRSYGGDYPKMNGFDQINNLLEEIKKNKYSRRLMINLWNPEKMYTDEVRLPCCHFACTFNINSKDEISCVLHQRSGDWLPGVSANIVFYSALTYMIARQFGLKPKELIHNVDNAHVYVDQIDAAKEYLSRDYKEFPTLDLDFKNIFEYTTSDFIINEYNYHDPIKIPVSV